MELKVGDLVVVKGRDFVGEILYIDAVEGTAEVEWHEYDYFTSEDFPIEKIELLNI
jgi:hypothetical protein